MGEAILKFKLPDEQDEFSLARNGGKYYTILVEIENIIRNHRKYGEKIQKCWDELVDTMNEFDMETEDL